MSRPFAVLSLSVLFAGCSVEEIDLTGKKCPCAAGYECDDSTGTCRKAGTGSGGASGGGGTAGTTSGGGTAGTTSGGGTAGTTSGGGTAGTTSGGGGTPSDGGGTGGAVSVITCGTSTCPLGTQKCCHASDGSSANGNCSDATKSCTGGAVDMFCDSPADCGGSKVCCERLTGSGSLSSIKCEAQASACVPSGSGTAALLCDPASPQCPSGTSCLLTPRGYSRCQ